ncbi:MAG TPA: glycosyltransferase family 4 protein [Tepidisphaeraceae bacterium]|nr:glycosyltransferase family 4 protein [Tepidisphaeraceae bacterium]
MKIVHVITRLIVGGAQENTLISCEGQHDRGHEVTLITGPPMGPEGSLLERANSYGYRVEVLDSMRRAILPGRDYVTYRTLVRRFRELKPDVVHTHSSKAGIIGRWAAAQAGVPVIVHTIHGLAFTASTSTLVNGFYKLMERWTAPRTTRIVCVADAMREQSLAAGIGRPEQYVTVYSGMETKPFLDPPVARAEVRRQLGLRENDIVIGAIARLFYLKGHDDLLELAPELRRRFADVRFLWVGDGLLREQFEERMKQMGLRERFVLTGVVPPGRIPELTGAMDILVHPSRREGLARALPQGSLAGKPVVTYDVDGNREALIEGKTGFAVPAFDKQRLAAAIEKLLADPALRQRMGEAGREFALSRFDAQVMVQALERIYQQARSLSPSPSGLRL